MLRFISLVFLFTSSVQLVIRAQSTFQNQYGTQGDDFVRAIIPTNDKGILMIGRTNNYANFHNILLIKVDKNGLIEWTKTVVGNYGDEFNFGSDGFQDSSGSFIIAGRDVSGSDQNFFLYVLDSLGNTSLYKSFGGTNIEVGRIILPFENKYVLTGIVNSGPINHGGNDILISILNKSGQNLKTYGFGGINNDFAQGFTITKNKRFVVSGYKRNYQSSNTGFILNTDFNGHIMWSYDYSISSGSIRFRSIINVENKGNFNIGWVDIPGTDKDILIVHSDSFGNVIWSKKYGGSSDDVPHGIIRVYDGNYVVLATTESFSSGGNDILIFKIDPAGKVLWSRLFGGPGDDFVFTQGHIIHESFDKGLIFAYESKNSLTNNFDIVLVKTDSIGRTPKCDYSNVNINESSITITRKNWNVQVDSLIWSGVGPLGDVKRNISQASLCCSDVYNKKLDTLICSLDTISISASPGISYSWSPSGLVSCDTCQYVEVSFSKDTFVVSSTLTSNGCNIVDTFYFKIIPEPVTNAGNDTLIFASTSVVLQGSGIGKVQWFPPDSLSCDTCLNPLASPIETTVYYLEITDIKGCKGLDSVIIFIIAKCENIFLPNAFTPNGDGLNDEFKILTSGKSAKLFIFQVYNRWGELLFETQDISKGWDGKFKGEQQPIGSYTYYFTVNCDGNDKQTFTGSVMLIR
jgi:gliding motility-associated-like protein